MSWVLLDIGDSLLDGHVPQTNTGETVSPSQFQIQAGRELMPEQLNVGFLWMPDNIPIYKLKWVQNYIWETFCDLQRALT